METYIIQTLTLSCKPALKHAINKLIMNYSKNLTESLTDTCIHHNSNSISVCRYFFIINTRKGNFGIN